MSAQLSSVTCEILLDTNKTRESVPNESQFHFSHISIKMSQPTWLTTSYFEEILRKNYRNTSIKVHKLKVEPCSETADGFLSTLLRAHVHFYKNKSHESESFVLKLSPSQDVTVEKVGVNGYNVHNKEMLFYEVIAPRIEKILKRAGDNDRLLPAVVAVDREHDVIVFKDLNALNFVLADRMVGLDTAQVHVALKKLAKFHAACLLMKQKHPTAFETFDAGMFGRKITAFNDAFLSIFEVVCEEIATWSGFGKYAAKIKLLQESFIERATKCFDVEDGEFCVLNHGDVWTNNVMFNKEGTQDAVLVRFHVNCFYLVAQHWTNSRSTSSSFIGVHQLWT